jgi:hypothetical protein
MRYAQVLVGAAVIALAGCGASAATTGGAATGSTTPASTPEASTSGTATAAATTAAAAGSGSFKATCPSTAEITSTLGQTYPAPRKNADSQDLTCDYTNSAADVLVIVFASTPNTTGADLKLAMDDQAKAQHVPDNAVPGLGEAAYEFTISDGTVELDMLNGSEDIAMTATTSLAHLETLAHDIVGS